MGAEGEALDLRCVLEARVADARSPRIEKESVDLVVTSPPYPMVQMWDEVFSSWSEEIAAGLAEERGLEVFERMHLELDRVWAACASALRLAASPASTSETPLAGWERTSLSIRTRSDQQCCSWD